tara:strand:- start:380 stop:838 length:459 start_codon:yes stop_codon:yes gene_type:complete
MIINKVKIHHNVKFGKGVKIVEPVNLYGCSLGNNVFIGPFVEIQENTTIDSYTRIQSHSFICSKVRIGKNCFIGHGVMFINDKFRSGQSSKGNTELWENTIILDDVYIGSNSTILPVKICKNVVIGAGSVVTKNINKSGVYAGNPAKYLRKI